MLVMCVGFEPGVHTNYICCPHTHPERALAVIMVVIPVVACGKFAAGVCVCVSPNHSYKCCCAVSEGNLMVEQRDTFTGDRITMHQQSVNECRYVVVLNRTTL